MYLNSPHVAEFAKIQAFPNSNEFGNRIRELWRVSLWLEFGCLADV
jgi:hypothetical protein